MIQYVLCWIGGGGVEGLKAVVDEFCERVQDSTGAFAW